MTEEQKNEYLKKYEAELISPAEAALWKRGASNAGYHYLGCAKTFALMGKDFAEANLAMMKQAEIAGYGCGSLRPLWRCSRGRRRIPHIAVFGTTFCLYPTSDGPWLAGIPRHSMVGHQRI